MAKNLKTPKASKRKQLTLASVGLFLILMGLVMIIVNPITILYRYRSRLTYGSAIYKLLEQRDSPGVTISAYLFNVTNGQEFLSGTDTKLKVEEVGPFTYLEQRSNENLEIDDVARDVRYTPRTRVKFLPEESIGDPADVQVNMPNVAMLSMSSMLTSYPYFTQLGFNLLLTHLNSRPIVQQTAEEFLWGYDEPLIRLGNTVLPGWISFNTLGIMDRLYDNKVDYDLKVATENDNRFKIKSMNGLSGLKAWGYEEPNQRSSCNAFTDAYEGIGYPIDFPAGTPLKIFRNVLCRFLPLEYLGVQSLQDGVQGLTYRIRKDTFSINNQTECLCSRGICIDGVSDLSPCFYDLPLALSNAHFLYANSSLYDRIDGIKPDETKHGSVVIIEPKLGMVLKTTFSVQVNVVVKSVNFNKEAGRFSDMVVPVCHFKMAQPELNAESKHNLKLLYLTVPYTMWTIVALIIFIGFFLVGYSIHLFLSNWIYSRSIIFQSEPEGSKANVMPAAVPLLSLR
ncbi:unnamed protein product [Chilo suppressalis]|uniref:Scavenger receptor class B member 1 n=1 Tax=Chilo suppressalis TaxID=168631 RepID=A0ABN8AT00_CHISP|nr:unnamed protein product [Chilo suppressalis]